jgi:hypothetical protein
VDVQTVVETPSYLRAATIFSDSERADIVAMIAADPECGEVMQGTGGFRKVRVGRGGIGKRGGARVVFILRNEGFPIFLITAYPKSRTQRTGKTCRRNLQQLQEVDDDQDVR